MFTKLYEKTKKFIKLNYKEIIFLIIFTIFMTFPMPYYIFVSGGTMNVGEKLEIENSYDEKGSFNFAYVSQLRGTLPFYLLSYVIPSWDRAPFEDYQISSDETMEDVNNRDIMYLQDANQSAIIVAYNKANKKVEISSHHYLIYYVDPKASNDIKIGDELLGVDNINTVDLELFKEYVNNKNVGDVITLRLKRNNKELSVKTTIFEEEGIKYAGLAFFDIIEYSTDPEIKINFDSDESGPSGGLTLALAIYNKLTEEDITKGLKIVGTGTIDVEGNVGTIGGVKYKLMGAVKSKADIFLVPNGENYEECIKLKKEKKYDIEIIGVSTFDEALEKLNNFK